MHAQLATWGPGLPSHTVSHKRLPKWQGAEKICKATQQSTSQPMSTIAMNLNGPSGKGTISSTISMHQAVSRSSPRRYPPDFDNAVVVHNSADPKQLGPCR